MATIAFPDDFALQKTRQLKRRYFTTQPIDASEYFDERYVFTYTSIAYCPEVERYRMWYNINHVVCEIGNQNEHFLLALAESEDAVCWRPCAGPDGSNVVFSGRDNSIHGAMVMRDAADPDPSRRYKCAASMDGIHGNQTLVAGIVATSPDGIRWDERDCRYQWGMDMSDAYNSIFFNPVLGEYQVIMRTTCTDRRIATRTSRDLVHWSPPRIILTPDCWDPPCSEFYGMSVFPADGIFYGFLWVFDTDLEDSDRVPWKFSGSVYSELVYSYDGLNWLRTHRKAVDLAPPGEYGSTDNYLFNTCVAKEGERWLTAGAFPCTGHGDGLYREHQSDRANSARMISHKICAIKPGRFCGLQSIGNHGFLRAKKIFLKQGDLTFNVAAPHGGMRVQLTDLWYRPVPGFTFEDSVPFRGDELAWKPCWKERRVGELAGKAFGIEVELQAGILYGISGDFLPFHASLPQQSYGNPALAFREVFGDAVEPDYDGVTLR